MRLANPEYLFLLIPVLLLLLLYLAGWVGKEASLKFSSLDLVRSSGARHFPLRRAVQALIRAALLVFLAAALVRPQTGEGHTETSREVVDIVIAIDVSGSMATLDFHPDNRLAAAKLEAKRFIEQRTEDRIGIVIFAKQSLTISPLTTDHLALLNLLERVELGTLEDGTAVGVGLANAINRLKESEAKSKVIILLTDGVNNSGEIDPLTAGDIARKLGIHVYTIGVGSDGYAMTPVNDPRGGRRLARMYTQIDEKTLMKIAQMTEGLYFRAKDETSLRQIFAKIDELERTEVKIHSYTTYNEHYAIFLQWALWAALAEIFLVQILWRKIP